ncbi:MAG: restriction endonuclease [Bacteroidales bacterium]|nr:restriction endonuclease [Bacteroidales bacterium]
MDKVDALKEILNKVEFPIQMQSNICIYTILALANIKKATPWKNATNDWLRVHDIISFANKNYYAGYAENSRETFRKQALHNFRNAAMVEDNGVATNSPNYRWRITDEFLSVLRNIDNENDALLTFKEQHISLVDLYSSKRSIKKMPVKINGADYSFGPGKHNQLQKAIIEEFAPRFAPNSECLYVGDTTDKDLVKDESKLQQLGFDITVHDKMPDIVLYREDKEWLYFIEAVTSVGPMDGKRLVELKAITSNVSAGIIFITAFLDFKTFKSFSDKLAWDTEVWIANMPDHMIHLNGDKFIGPR